MHYTAFILSALAVPLAIARPALAQPSSNAQGIELYAPTYIMDTSAYWPEGGSPSTEIKCKEAGPSCVNFPPGAAPNETVSVRVFCVAQGHKKKIKLRPKLMSPCPEGSQCAVMSKRRTHHSLEDRSADTWLWLEDADGDVAGLSGEDVSSWINLDGLLREVDGGADDINITVLRDEAPPDEEPPDEEPPNVDVPGSTPDISGRKKNQPPYWPYCLVDDDDTGKHRR
ncbi:hypothetical protein EKO27_g376 [Xylaria grammica]|uniref:Uncharacterized protein n=1 Tax=Xylaria grammica TaxID=363999 RepID=A0A439DK49_9PEZI|nr:hypothetical protein EKO27_g376 [Xylaria grammica]